MGSRPAFPPLKSSHKRRTSSASANVTHKARAAAIGRLKCEICGFFDKRYLPFGLIQAHHIRQRQSGGQDVSSNLINLCPTHHAQADRLSRENPNLTRDQLIAALKPHAFPIPISASSASPASSSCGNSANLVMSAKTRASFPEVGPMSESADPQHGSKYFARITDAGREALREDSMAEIQPDVPGMPDSATVETLDKMEAESFKTMVASIKADFLQVPIVAHTMAVRGLSDAKMIGDKDLILVYEEVVRQLAAEGYAPDPDSGNPGVATKAHYTTGILGD